MLSPATWRAFFRRGKLTVHRPRGRARNLDRRSNFKMKRHMHFSLGPRNPFSSSIEQHEPAAISRAVHGAALPRLVAGAPLLLTQF
jgi:hypothetical protein